MFTRNFDAMMVASALGVDYNGILHSIYANVVVERTEANYLSGQYPLVKDQTGSIYTATLRTENSTDRGLLGFSASSGESSLSFSTGAPTLLIGSSSAEETYDDYTISAFTSSQVSVVAGGKAYYSYSGGKMTSHITKTFSNKTSADITVNEAGIFCGIHGAGTSASTAKRSVLMYRKKFDTPIIIPANGSATVSIDIEMPFGAHNPNA